jgi:hypothetical protein
MFRRIPTVQKPGLPRNGYAPLNCAPLFRSVAAYYPLLDLSRQVNRPQLMTHAADDCQRQLASAVRAARAPVTGWRRIHHFQHAILVKTALAAFGNDNGATFYIETLSPNTSLPRPDLIILHPDIGVLAIENKGITLEQIHAVVNTAIHLTRDGRIKIEDPFAQVERIMYTHRRAKARDFIRTCPHCQFKQRVHTNRPLESF